MSKDDRYRSVLANLDSGSPAKVYNALAFIRSHLLKEKGGVDKLCRFGFMSRLFQSLQDDSEGAADKATPCKPLDLCLSIVSNMCMEKCARLAVANIADSIPTLVSLLEEWDVQSVKNRVCRTLANLALDPGACTSIMATDATTLVVDFMLSTDDIECKKTCCRALRLFGYSDRHRRKVAIHGGVYPVACLLKHEDSHLSEYGLRALAELSKKCSFECASQIVNAGVAEKIVEMAQEQGTLASSSFWVKIFMNLMVQPNARACVGSSGGITFLLSLVEEEKEPCKKIPLLNCLCLFCRESANRGRIRDMGILDIFVDSLQNDSLRPLHPRLISAFLCFIYDDAGLNHLLCLKTVGTLLKHLQFCAAFMSKNNPILLESVEQKVSQLQNNNRNLESMKRPLPSPDKINVPRKRFCAVDVSECEFIVPATSPGEVKSLPVCGERRKMPTSSVDEAFIVAKKASKKLLEEQKDILKFDNAENQGEGARSLVVKSVPDLEAKRENTTTSNDDVFTASDPDMFNSAKDDINVNTHKLSGEQKDIQELDLAEIPKVKAEQAVFGGKSDRGHVYSLDSPTYEAQYTEWNLEDFRSSVKCKQSFSPDSLSLRSLSPSKLSSPSSPSYQDTLSPLSVVSYYSPEYSPQYSPLRGAVVSPGSSSICGSVASCPSSPNRSISPSDFMDATEGPSAEYSSDEGDAETNPERFTSSETAEHSADKNELSPSLVLAKVEAMDLTIKPEKCQMDSNELALNDNKGHVDTAEIVTSEDESLFDSSKPSTLVEDIKDEDQSTETKPESAGEKDLMEASMSGSGKKRDPRICRTTADNILIFFSRVSQMSVPTPLVSEDFICGLLDYITKSEKPNSRASRLLQRLMRNPLCLELLLDALTPVYIVDKIYGGRVPESLKTSLCFDQDDANRSSALSTPTKSKKDISLNRLLSTSDVEELDKSNDSLNPESEDVSDSLLRDLSFVVESRYGRGTIAHILKRKAEAQKIRCLLCLPFLCRSTTSQKKTLFDDGALEHLLDMALPINDCCEEMLRVIVLGLQFMAAYLDVQLKLPSVKGEFPQHKAAEKLVDSCCGTGELETSDKMALDLTVSSTRSAEFGGGEAGTTDDVDENADLCFHSRSQSSHDVMFLLDDGSQLMASKVLLVAVSPVFQAMLDGNYTESRQAIINIPHMSQMAFQFLLHFLHGCGPGCIVIKIVVEGRCTFESFLDVISLADRYLLTSLQSYLETVAKVDYMSLDSMPRLYNFASLHNYRTLAEDCLRFLLTDTSPISKRLSVFRQLLSDQNAGFTLQHMHSLLKCHVFS